MNHNKKVNNNTGNKIIKKVKIKKNCTPKINVKNKNRYWTENIKLHGDENSINSNIISIKLFHYYFLTSFILFKVNYIKILLYSIFHILYNLIGYFYLI